MQVVLNQSSKDIQEIFSSVSQKGQVTIPLVIRKRLGVKPKDKVAFRVVGDEIKLVPKGSPLAASFQAIPALKKHISVEEMTKIAADEHLFP